MGLLSSQYIYIYIVKRNNCTSYLSHFLHVVSFQLWQRQICVTFSLLLGLMRLLYESSIFRRGFVADSKRTA